MICRDFTTESSLPRDEGRDWERQWVGFSLKRWVGLNLLLRLNGSGRHWRDRRGEKGGWIILKGSRDHGIETTRKSHHSNRR